MKNRSRNRIIALAAVIAAAVIIIVIAAAVRIRSNPGSEQRAEAEETRLRLESMSERDMASVQGEIDLVRGVSSGSEDTAGDADSPAGGGEVVLPPEDGMLPLDELKEYNYKEIFSGCVILGDSIAEGLSDYDILNSSEVFAVEGVHVGAVDASLVNAASMNPKKAFFTYGMNDILYYGNELEIYREDYTALLTRARELMPDTEFYVMMPLPVSDYALSKHEGYYRRDEYIEALKEVCGDLGITWLDLGFTMLDEYYDADELHPLPDFYYGWLYYMALGSGLIQR